MILGRLHGWSLRAQVLVMFGCVAFVSATLSVSLGNIGVRVALDGQDPALVHRAAVTVGLVACAVAACTVIAAFGAAAFLRSSLGGIVDDLALATSVIARGSFDHRIESRRRDELGSLARSVDAMAQRLARLEQSRQQLLASVSHELRTPLTVIRGEAFTLARAERDVRRRARLELIDAEVERLAAMVDDLLAASTLRAAGISIEQQPEDAASLVEAAARRFRALARQRGVSLDLRVRCTASVNVDAARMHQVIGNLLANAISHAPPASVVGLRVGRSRGRRGGIIVAITNDGPGIPADQLEGIFEPFAQGSTPTGSVGLGLSIARDLARAHGTDVAVRSRPGMTVFSLLLPLATGVTAAGEVRRIGGGR